MYIEIYYCVNEYLTFEKYIKITFQQPLLQCLVSHASSETILIIDAYETFLIMLKTFVLLNIFVETVIQKNVQDLFEK